MNGKPSKFWSTELTSCFGYPKHYLNAMDLKRRDKFKLLAKAWCVHRVSNILRFLTLFYLREP